MKIWQCYDGLAAQQWVVTDDQRIVLNSTSFCLDDYKGILTNDNKVQTWTCSDGNTNQVWTFDKQTPPPVKTLQLHPNGNTKKCLDVRGAVYANGTPVQV